MTERIVIVAVATMLFLSGCDSTGGPHHSPDPPPVSFEEPLGTVYIQCREEEAEIVLIIDLTVRGCFDSIRDELPLRSVKPEDFTRGNSAWMGCADGFSPRWWCNSSVRVVDTVAPGVTVNVYAAWMAKDGTEGQIQKEVTLPVGRPSERKLSDAVSFKASFRTPRLRAGEKDLQE